MGDLIPLLAHLRSGPDRTYPTNAIVISLCAFRASLLERLFDLGVDLIEAKAQRTERAALVALCRDPLEQSRHRRFLIRWEQQIARYEAEERRLKGCHRG